MDVFLALYLNLFFEAWKKGYKSHDLDVFLIEVRENEYPIIPDEISVAMSATAFLASRDKTLWMLVTNNSVSLENFRKIVHGGSFVHLE